jgi:hypothetical protein
VLEENGPLTFGQIARLCGIRYKSVEQFLVTLDNSGEALLMEDDSGRVSLFEMQYE